MVERLEAESPESKAVGLLARHDAILLSGDGDSDHEYPKLTEYLSNRLPVEDPETAQALFQHWVGQDEDRRCLPLGVDTGCVLAPMAMRFVSLDPTLGSQMVETLLKHRSPYVAKAAIQSIMEWTAAQQELQANLISAAHLRLARLSIGG
jgi:hypothetical protein